MDINVRVAYDSDLTSARQALLQALATIPGVLEDPAPVVAFHTVTASTVDATAYYWVDTSQTNPRDAKDAGIVAIKAAAEQSGVEIR